jgi:hypothetical protein
MACVPYIRLRDFPECLAIFQHLSTSKINAGHAVVGA